MKKALLLLGAAAAMAACSDATAPRPTAVRHAPAGANATPAYDITCRSGYIIAYDQNGDPYCAPGGDQATTASTTTKR